MDKILIGVIRAKIEKEPCNYSAYEDLFSLCRNGLTENKKEALHLSAELRSICEANIRKLDGAIITNLIALIDRRKYQNGSSKIKTKRGTFNCPRKSK